MRLTCLGATPYFNTLKILLFLSTFPFFHCTPLPHNFNLFYEYICSDRLCIASVVAIITVEALSLGL